MEGKEVSESIKVDSGLGEFDKLVKRRYEEFPALERKVTFLTAEIARLKEELNRLKEKENDIEI